MTKARRAIRLVNGLLVLWYLLSTAAGVLAQGPQVDVLTVRGAITPVFVSYIDRGLQLAEEEGAALVVIQLDTPGGQVSLMQEIVQRIVSSPVPVVVYVTPRGAQAASAGTVIVLAGHVAAMAPNTSIGAASPVGGQGEDLSETMKEKAVNALVAQVKTLAQRRGDKAVGWAERAVREAAAATEEEALELGVVDLVVPDLDELIKELDGRQVTVGQETVTLDTGDAWVKEVPMTPVESFLHTITNPNIAFILMTIGINGLLFELSSPGGFLAGIVGGISLLLGLYALGVLNVNYTGLLFIALAFVLFVADIKAPTHGALTAGGIVSFVLGSLMLFNSPLYSISRSLVVGVALGSAGFFAFAVQAAVRAQRRQVTTGREGLVGELAVARTDLDPEGTVFLHGELWKAVVEGDNVTVGARVRVMEVEGFVLKVRCKNIERD